MSAQRFGWLTWDGERVVETVTGRPLPFSWQRFRSHDAPESQMRDTDGIEALMPLENMASLWLFADHYIANDTWEVAASLYMACPLHPRPFDQRRCEFWAHWVDANTVTNAAGCGGPSCEGCWHDNEGDADVVTSDPGDAEEFWELARQWSGLTVVPTFDVRPHDDHYDWCIAKGIAA